MVVGEERSGEQEERAQGRRKEKEREQDERGETSGSKGGRGAEPPGTGPFLVPACVSAITTLLQSSEEEEEEEGEEEESGHGGLCPAHGDAGEGEVRAGGRGRVEKRWLESDRERGGCRTSPRAPAPVPLPLRQ